MNDSIFYFLYGLAHQSPVFDRAVIFLGTVFPFLVVFSVCVFIFWRRGMHKRENFSPENLKGLVMDFGAVFAPVVAAFILATVLKEVMHVDRSFVSLDGVFPLFEPNQEYSFPSTHATFFGSLAAAGYFFEKRFGIFLAVCAIIVGMARIVAGVHFPADILGGFVLGVLVVFSIYLVICFLSQKYIR